MILLGELHRLIKIKNIISNCSAQVLKRKENKLIYFLTLSRFLEINIMNVDNENTTKGSNPNEGCPSDTVIEVRHLDVWHIIKVYRVGRSEKVVFPICARVNLGMILRPFSHN